MKSTILRRSLQLLTLGSALLAPALFAATDTTPPPPPHHGGGPGEGHFDPAKRLARMTERLNLTAEQQAKIRPILVAETEAIKALNVAEDQRREQMRQIRKDTRPKIAAILTPEQIKLWAEMRPDNRGPRGEHAEAPPAPPTPAPVPAPTK